MKPPNLGEVMAGNSHFLYFYYTSPGQRRILTRAARQHKKNCDLLNTGAYLSQILFSLFRHTRGVRSKSSRALRL
ncbi:hypothetical protein HanRHA438_Chr03g0128531 [Helianthus annuus]|nr:hypothetical protein HanRHA438_Chr03g0128531 [Helianthus annuus]